MSKKGEIVSAEVRDEAKTASVFDFLYHDSRRIASFLSQFDANGLLTGLTQSEAVTKGAKRGKRFDVGASTPFTGGGNLGFEIGPGESGSESLERIYDPFWANARQFLDVLEEHGMIQRDVESATMGQFVLIQGSLVISDLKMLQVIWALPTIRKTIISAALKAAESEEDETTLQNRQERRMAKSKATKRSEPEIPHDLATAMEVLPLMPHGGQMHIVNNDYAAWAPVSDGCLVSPISELILKHGQKVAGEWSMLGILDAQPFAEEDMLTPIEMVRVGMFGDSIGKAALALAIPIRQILGRPLLSYGITPLLVFREVA